MIALDAMVGVLLGVVERVWGEFFDDGLERLGEIGDHFVGIAMSEERCVEECSGCQEIALVGQVHVDDLALFINGSVDVPPFLGNVRVGLVDEPAATGGVAAWSGGVDE